MKAHLRISVKDFQRNKNLKIQLARVPFTHNRQFWVKMNGQPWPKLVEGMKWLWGTYARRHNRRHKKFGHPFSGRY